MGLLLGKDISPLSFNEKGAHLILFFSLVMLLKLLPLSGENLHENKREDLVVLSASYHTVTECLKIPPPLPPPNSCTVPCCRFLHV